MKVTYNYEEKDKSWDSGFRPVTSCPYMNLTKYVLVSKEVIDMAETLSRSLTGYEWLMYCDVEEDDTSIRIHSCMIPEQEVTYSDVEVKKGSNLPVVIHSHHSMNLNEFSNIDDEFINSNHRVSILWTDTRGVSNVVVKVNLPCGHVALVKTDKVMVYIPQNYNEEEVKKKVQEQLGNIKKKAYTYKHYSKDTVYPGYYSEYSDEVERTYREYFGDYYGLDDDESKSWFEEEEESIEEGTPELWKSK